jgi:tryptophan-rich sensory protein
MTALASRGQLRMSFLRHALVTVPAVLLLGTLSAVLSGSGEGNPWFAALAKPAFMPPGWVFGVAWTLLYIGLGVALAMILHARGARGRSAAIAVFLVQLLLNYAWPPVFFGLHLVRPALLLIVVIILLAVLAAFLFLRIRPVAALLMLPYLAWLCFAAALNYEIGRLNPEGGRVAPAPSSADIPI